MLDLTEFEQAYPKPPGLSYKEYEREMVRRAREWQMDRINVSENPGAKLDMIAELLDDIISRRLL